MPVKWEGENERKVLLYILKRTETKDIDVDLLASLIEGATPTAVRERISVLRIKAKTAFGDQADEVKGPYTGKPRGRPKETKDVNANGNGATAFGDQADEAKAPYTGKPRGRPKKIKDGTANGNGNGIGATTAAEKKVIGAGKRKRAGGMLAEHGSADDGAGGEGDGDEEEDGGGEVKRVKVEQEEDGAEDVEAELES